tara:strand:- start:8049 stop:9011 length:963 start_codon:yes stop_codon:yes gene_type:complete
MKTLQLLFTLLSLVSVQQSTAQEVPKCPSTPYLIVSPGGYDHTRYAPSQQERLFDGGSFIASIDGEDDDNGDNVEDYLVQPTWVASHIKAYQADRPSGYAPAFKRPSPWYRLKFFDEEREYFKSKKRIDDSYRGVGNTWNRGHLAQRADANRIAPEYGCNTHVFANAVPQRASLNQGIWLGLENYISSLANQKGEVWVVTGPIFSKNSKLETIGDAGEIPVPIPDQIFKVVFMESNAGVQVLSFIYDNKYDYTPPEYKSGRCQSDLRYDHTPFLVSLADVERATGLTFFGDIDQDLSDFKEQRASRLPALEADNHVGYCL